MELKSRFQLTIIHSNMGWLNGHVESNALIISDGFVILF